MATLRELRKVAKECNDLEFIDEVIDLTLPESKLLEKLKQVANCIDPEQDPFSEESQAIIDEIADHPIFAKREQEVAEKIHKQNVTNKPVKTSPEVEQEEEPRTLSGRKQVPIPVKKEKAVKTEKKELFAKKSSTTADRIAFISPFIEKGKFTKAQLVEKMTEKFPDLAVSSISTLLTDAKNPKYNKFPKLVVQDDKGLLSFKEE